jgi:hypothetical protein
MDDQEKHSVVLILLGAFFVFFVLCFFIGVSKRFSPEYVEPLIAQHIALDVHDDNVYATFTCPALGKLYRYDVDTKYIESFPLTSHLANKHRLTQIHTLVSTSFLTLGSIAGGYAGGRAKDVIGALETTMLTRRTSPIVHTIFGAIAGVLSGYSIGQWLGTQFPLSCNYDDVIDYLRDAHNWEPALRYMYNKINYSTLTCRLGLIEDFWFLEAAKTTDVRISKARYENMKKDLKNLLGFSYAGLDDVGELLTALQTTEDSQATRDTVSNWSARSLVVWFVREEIKRRNAPIGVEPSRADFLNIYNEYRRCQKQKTASLETKQTKLDNLPTSRREFVYGEVSWLRRNIRDNEW